VLVSSAQDRAIEEAIRFRETLQRDQLPFVGAIVNRVTQPLTGGNGALQAEAGGWEQILPSDLASRVAASAADHAVLASRDAANIERVPDFSDDIHDVEGLLAIHRVLFDG
jgi:hypothetical protein